MSGGCDTTPEQRERWDAEERRQNALARNAIQDDVQRARQKAIRAQTALVEAEREVERLRNAATLANARRDALDELWEKLGGTKA